MFDSSFAEGRSVTNAALEGSVDDSEDTTGKSYLSLKRRIIVEDGFDLFHNILYYIYTNRITFGTNLAFLTPSTLPKLCATEDIYQIADRLFLTELKHKALDFLTSTCTIENITSRILGKFAFLHEDVEERYVDYFRKNWDVVKETKEFNNSFTDMNGDIYGSNRLIEMFPELMNSKFSTTVCGEHL